MLTCAVERKIGYCLRDCDQFPCEKFSSGPFPFSDDFMKMQSRRREQIGAMPAASWPETTPRFWEILLAKEPAEFCRSTGATLTDDGKYRLKSLNDYWLIDIKQKSIIKVPIYYPMDATAVAINLLSKRLLLAKKSAA